MCLFIEVAKHSDNKPKIAEEDIVCWKYLQIVGEEIAYSLIHDFRWQKGDVYEEEMSRRNPDSMTVDIGFHAFLDEDAVFTFFQNVMLNTNTSHYSVHTNISHYSATQSTEMEERKEEMNAKMVIPKGAHYYLGDKHDIVADKMKLVEIYK